MDHKGYRIIDAQERIIGSPLRRRDVEELVRNKKHSRVVYEFGGERTENKFIEGNVGSELLKYNRSNPNLKSQIITSNQGGRSGDSTERQYQETMNRLNETLGEVRYGSLSRVQS
jgi:hypothetical protein